MKKSLTGMACLVIIFWMWAAAGFCSDSAPDTSSPIPTPGMVTLVDFGGSRCIPCKMMEPILAQIIKEYEKKVSILILDVEKQPDIAKRFGVRAIPTQIFYGNDGKEMHRHEGFIDKRSMVSIFEKLGVQQ